MKTSKVVQKRIRAYYYEYVKIPLVRKFLFRDLKIKSSTESINLIIENKYSVSRYGDGELDVIFGGCRGFQQYDSNLATRLREVLCSNLPNHIVCLPYPFLDSTFLRNSSNQFWSYYVGMNFKKLLQIINLRKQYYDTEITRFYIDYKDRSRCSAHIALLKKIWESRDIIIVEGCYTISGTGNDLFNSANSVKRIICPAENAYEKYYEILESVKTNANKENLILLSLGMTATVMAYDLASVGLQAIDLGHLDIEYEWFLNEADWKIALPNRYVNEVYGGNKVNKCTDPIYLSQIIAQVT